MSSANIYYGLDTRIVRCIRHHARLAGGRVPGWEIEDLEQELFLHVHRRLHHFDEQRASFPTFIDRIVRNRIAQLLAASAAAKRGGGQMSISLESVTEASNEAADEPDDISFEPGHAPEADLALLHDVRRVVDCLPAHLSECCAWLLNGSISEAARRSGLARSSIHGRIATVRRRFREAGLQIYLSASPTVTAAPR